MPQSNKAPASSQPSTCECSANGPASPPEPQPGTSTGGVTPSGPQVNVQCGSDYESENSESDGDHDNDPQWRPTSSVPLTCYMIIYYFVDVVCQLTFYCKMLDQTSMPGILPGQE